MDTAGTLCRFLSKRRFLLRWIDWIPEFTMPDYAELLDADGPLARHIPDFAPRPQQQVLSQAVGHALEQLETLLAEAGTGVGKTFAYLVPALLAGRRVLISTGTRNLQDQLYHRDLPVVRDAIGMPVKVALLKGRSNYLCRHRLSINSTQGSFENFGQIDELQQILAWAQNTKRGDIAELEGLPEDTPTWRQVTSTNDNCLGQKCPEYSRCFLVNARRQAQEADIVIVNHHLLMADMVLKEDGFGQLLPDAEAVIVDEAHQLPEIATQYFGQAISSRQVYDFKRDTLAEYQEIAACSDAFTEKLLQLDKTLSAALAAAGTDASGSRREWLQDDTQSRFDVALQQLLQQFLQIAADLENVAVRSRGLENCWQRALGIAGTLDRFLTVEEKGDEQVRWIETYGRSFTLNLTPLDAASRFRERKEETQAAWIFISATLSVAGQLEHFRERLGLVSGSEVLLDSPFDYASNALLYLPERMPAVDSPDYVHAVVEHALPVIDASCGRAFMLFTSHRALRRAAELLQGRVSYPLLQQGEMPRRRLLERFRELGNAVLLGTSSFWEGVDVRGPALSVVVIDKLPFASPSDPVLKARLNAMRSRGEDPFRALQLPQAVLTLKQGVGRLIRDNTDTGVMMICDPRLTGRYYGKVFLASLPPMRRTRDVTVVESFLSSHEVADA